MPPASAADAPAWGQYGGPTRDFALATPLPAAGKGVLWKRKLGPGTSGVVTDGKQLFTMYSVPDPKTPNRGEEVVVALDATTGETKWEHRYPVERLKGQETFSGDPVRPQATPAVLGDRVCAVGYAGKVTCLAAATGKVLWEVDLVKDYAAKPVQFGFSASPLVYEEAFILHVGGPKAALVALRPDGTVKWKSEPGEPSYASPVVARFGGEDQIVQVTQKAVVGFRASDGAVRWSYPMENPGLTNVPTPVPLPDGRLLVSGQGMVGTRLLKIEGQKATEVWKTKGKFFYCNALADDKAVYGVTDAALVAVSLADGRELWREAGQKDANLVRVGDEALVLRGDGLLTRGKLAPAGLERAAEVRLLKGRCWTPPTVLGGAIVVRDQAEVVAVDGAAFAKK
jgi:outer membrane protein assembly factor BamB